MSSLTPEQMARLVLFGTALAKLRKAAEDEVGCILTPDEVKGMLFGVRSLRGNR